MAYLRIWKQFWFFFPAFSFFCWVVVFIQVLPFEISKEIKSIQERWNWVSFKKWRHQFPIIYLKHHSVGKRANIEDIWRFVFLNSFQVLLLFCFKMYSYQISYSHTLIVFSFLKPAFKNSIVKVTVSKLWIKYSSLLRFCEPFPSCL